MQVGTAPHELRASALELNQLIGALWPNLGAVVLTCTYIATHLRLFATWMVLREVLLVRQMVTFIKHGGGHRRA